MSYFRAETGCWVWLDCVTLAQTCTEQSPKMTEHRIHLKPLVITANKITNYPEGINC